MIFNIICIHIISSRAEEYTFFSTIKGTFLKIDYKQDIRQSNKFKMVKLM